MNRRATTAASRVRPLPHNWVAPSTSTTPIWPSSSIAAEIRDAYGYRDFSAHPDHFRLVRWLYVRSRVSADRPSIIFDLATAWLVGRKVHLPRVPPSRLNALARYAASAWAPTIARMPDDRRIATLVAFAKP